MIAQKYGWWFEKGVKNTFKSTPKPMDHIIMLTFTFTKDNKAYIAYISGNELVIEEVE
jgi:hypothetical protein